MLKSLTDTLVIFICGVVASFAILFAISFLVSCTFCRVDNVEKMNDFDKMSDCCHDEKDDKDLSAVFSVCNDDIQDQDKCEGDENEKI